MHCMFQNFLAVPLGLLIQTTGPQGLAGVGVRYQVQGVSGTDWQDVELINGAFSESQNQISKSILSPIHFFYLLKYYFFKYLYVYLI